MSKDTYNTENTEWVQRVCSSQNLVEPVAPRPPPMVQAESPYVVTGPLVQGVH